MQCLTIPYELTSSIYFIDAVSYSNAYFGEGTGTIELDDVSCYGDENTLLDCTHSTIGTSDCEHYEDAGVKCQSTWYILVYLYIFYMQTILVVPMVHFV